MRVLLYILLSILSFQWNELYSDSLPDIMGCSDHSKFYLAEANAEDYYKTDYIFTARVQKISKTQKACTTHLQVQQIFRGQPKKQIIFSDCRFNSYHSFLPGKTYLIYTNEKDGKPQFPYCNRTRELIETKNRYSSPYYGITLQVFKEKQRKGILRELAFLRSLQKQQYGSVQARFINGRPSARGNLQKGQPHGQWEYYLPDGTVKSRGQYKNGQKIGIWLEGNFERMARNSSLVYLQHKGKYQQGKKLKSWSTYHRGVKLYETKYKIIPQNKTISLNQTLLKETANP